MSPSVKVQSAELKKNKLQPHMNDYWCIPSKEDADFVACMEDVLDVYELPYNPARPVVCMDKAIPTVRRCEGSVTHASR